MTINKGMDKENVTYIHKETLLTPRKNKTEDHYIK